MGVTGAQPPVLDNIVTDLVYSIYILFFIFAGTFHAASAA